MQLFAVTAALFAALATAGPVRRGSTFYKVSKFQASCDPHGGNCKYQFYLLRSNNAVNTETPPGVRCSKTLAQDAGGLLPAVTDGTCEHSDRTWTVTKNSDGSLTLAAQEPASVAGTSLYDGAAGILSVNDLNPEQNGQPGQIYTGKADFDLVSMP